MVLVIVVPIFAPIIMGTALSSVIEPEATSATTMAVVVELLCIMAVISKPINKPVNGLDVAKIMVSAVVLPRCWSEETIRSIAKRKSKRAPTMYKTVRTVSHKCCFLSGKFSWIKKCTLGNQVSKSVLIMKANEKRNYYKGQRCLAWNSNLSLRMMVKRGIGIFSSGLVGIIIFATWNNF